MEDYNAFWCYTMKLNVPTNTLHSDSSSCCLPMINKDETIHCSLTQAAFYLMFDTFAIVYHCLIFDKQG